MRILIVVDKENTALHRLAVGIKRYNPHLHIDILPVHPKKPTEQSLFIYRDLAKQADIIHFNYWKSGEMLKEKFPEFNDKKFIVSHHNPYNIKETNPKDYSATVVNNVTMLREIGYACHHIPLGVDINFFKTAEEYHDEDKRVLMVANRIEAKKGILSVAKACNQLGYKFVLVGNISDNNYFEEIVKEGVELNIDVTDEKLLQLYQTSALHVCNSIDNFESGTLPILEAMASGCPVMTRKVGHVPELYNGKNLHLYEGMPDDIDALKESLKVIMEDRELRLHYREEGWNTVKNWSLEKHAYLYQKLYYSVFSNKPLVSVIIPTYNRPDALIKCLAGIVSQTYENIEIVIVDDGSEEDAGVDKIIEQTEKFTSFPIKHHYMQRIGYGLARARNKGILESVGRYVLFLDDRLQMNPTAVEEFAKVMNIADSKTVLWGVKDSSPKSFVENFSMFLRQSIINAGMFCERVNVYGGMTQEIRTRLESQGFKFKRVDTAEAKAIVKSSSKWAKRGSIAQAKMILFKLYGDS